MSEAQLETHTVSDSDRARNSHLCSTHNVCSNLVTTGADFAFPVGFMLDFPPGVMSLNVSLEIFEDDIVEQEEVFSLQLTVPANIPRSFVLGDIPTAVITLADDDCESAMYIFL